MKHGILYYFGIAFIAMAIVKGVQLIWHPVKERDRTSTRLNSSH